MTSARLAGNLHLESAVELDSERSVVTLTAAVFASFQWHLTDEEVQRGFSMGWDLWELDRGPDGGLVFDPEIEVVVRVEAIVSKSKRTRRVSEDRGSTTLGRIPRLWGR